MVGPLYGLVEPSPAAHDRDGYDPGSDLTVCRTRAHKIEPTVRIVDNTDERLFARALSKDPALGLPDKASLTGGSLKIGNEWD